MLEGKTIVIAGAAGVLGVSLVKAVLEANGSVVATDLSAEHLGSRLSSAGVNPCEPNLTIRELDICQPEKTRLFWKCAEGITGAVNCSYPRGKSYGAEFFDVKLADFNENITLHLGSSFVFAQQCASYFLRSKIPFSLVNISSIYGVIAPKFQIYDETKMTMPVEYAVIKSALLHLNKYIAKYISNSDFRVNSISPGGLLDGQPESFLSNYKSHTFGAGLLDANTVTGAILFLLSDASRFVTGQNIIVDDGFTL